VHAYVDRHRHRKHTHATRLPSILFPGTVCQARICDVRKIQKALEVFLCLGSFVHTAGIFSKPGRKEECFAIGYRGLWVPFTTLRLSCKCCRLKLG